MMTLAELRAKLNRPRLTLADVVEACNPGEDTFAADDRRWQRDVLTRPVHRYEYNPETEQSDEKLLGHKPVRLLHGTRADFRTFKPSAGGAAGPGIYLTPNTKKASAWAGERKGSRVLMANVRGKFKTVSNWDDYLGNLDKINKDARTEGYHGLYLPWVGEYVVFDPKDVRPESGGKDFAARAAVAEEEETDEEPQLDYTDIGHPFHESELDPDNPPHMWVLERGGAITSAPVRRITDKHNQATLWNRGTGFYGRYDPATARISVMKPGDYLNRVPDALKRKLREHFRWQDEPQWHEFYSASEAPMTYDDLRDRLQQNFAAPPGAKYERLVKKLKGRRGVNPYAVAWAQFNKKHGNYAAAPKRLPADAQVAKLLKPDESVPAKDRAVHVGYIKGTKTPRYRMKLVDSQGNQVERVVSVPPNENEYNAGPLNSMDKLYAAMGHESGT